MTVRHDDATRSVDLTEWTVLLNYNGCLTKPLLKLGHRKWLRPTEIVNEITCCVPEIQWPGITSAIKLQTNEVKVGLSQLKWVCSSGTVKPVSNDHLYNKIYYLWFIQWYILIKTEGTNLLSC